MTDEMRMSYGNHLVATDFNPSGHRDVRRIKEKAAELIDELSAISDPDVARWKNIAITHIETGCMFGVKAAVNQLK